MAIDRFLALVVLTICLIYGYTAFFIMDEALSPFMKFSPVWPSSFPKILSLSGCSIALVILLTSGSPQNKKEIDLSRRHEYKFWQALALLFFMVVYTFSLFPAGFVLSTFLFITASGLVLGERRKILLSVIAAISALVVWYLVQEVLGIFLRPWPEFLSGLFP